MADGEDRTTSFSVRVTGDGKTVDNVALHGPVEGDAKPGDPALVAPATETNRVSHEVLAGTKPEGQAGGGKPSGAYPHTGAGSDSVILTGLGILATGMGCVIALRLRKSRRGGNQTPPKVY
jgi:LPXTG-motif cell wall-anchored protein